MAFWSDGGQIFPHISVAKACGSPCRAQGRSYQEFLSQWSRDNLLLNDHKVAEQLKRVIKEELQDEVDARPDGQKNVSRQAFMLCNRCDH